MLFAINGQALAIEPGLVSRTVNLANSPTSSYLELSEIHLHKLRISEQMLDAQKFSAAALLLCGELAREHKLEDSAYKQYLQAHLQGKILKLLTLQSFNQSKTNALGSEAFNQQFNQVCQLFIERFAQSESGDTSLQTLPDIAQELLTYAEEVNASQLRIELFESLWLYHNGLDLHQQAKGYARLALSTLPFDAHKAKVSFYSKLGTSLIRQSNYTQAIYSFRQGLVSALALSDNRQLSDAYFNLAYSYRYLGQLILARRYFEFALMTDLSGLEVVQPETGNLCVSSFPSSGYNSQSTSQLILASKSMLQLGVIERELGHYQQSTMYLQCAMQILSETDDFYKLVAIIELNKSQLLLDANYQLNDDFKRLLHSDQLIDSQEVDAWLLQLEVAIKQGDKAAFYEANNRLLGLFGNNGEDDFSHGPELDPALYQVRQIYYFRLLMLDALYNHNKPQVNSYAEKGIKLINAISLNERANKAWRHAQYHFVDQYINALLRLNSELEQLDIELIFNLLEGLDSSSALNSQSVYQSYAQQAELDAELAELWRTKLKAQKALITTNVENKKHRRVQADRADEMLRAKGTTTVVMPNSFLDGYSRQKTQHKLAAGQLYLRYFISDNNSLAIYLTKDKFGLFKLPSKGELQQAVQHTLADGLGNVFTTSAASQALSAILPLELLQSGSINSLVITPDSVLSALPFAILDITPGQQNYTALISRFELSYTRSVNDYFSSNKAVNPTEKHSIAIFANPVMQQSSSYQANLGFNRDFSDWYSNLPKLPYTEYEAKSIARYFDRALFGIGPSATTEFLLSESVRKSSVIHIASHGYYDKNTPELLGLITALQTDTERDTGGFFSLETLMSKPFEAELVVLNGCETLIGKYYRGSGYRGLVQGFLSQGANAVLGTFWKIADKPSAYFMQRFYRHYHRLDRNYRKALQQTQLELMSSGPYKHPKYWAAYVVYQ